MIVALVEAYAQRAGLDPADLWAYLDRRKAPPAEVRAALVDAFFPVVRPDDFVLPSGPYDDKLRAVESTPLFRTIPGRPLKSPHKFAEWLRGQRLTLADWARNHIDPGSGQPYKRERVKQWIAEAPHARPIPRVTAELIERESKGAVKANLRTWSAGIRE